MITVPGLREKQSGLNKGPSLLLGGLALFMSLLAGPAQSLDVVIVDQNGDAVTSAFVAIPEGEIAEPKSESAIMDQVDVKFVPHVLAVDAGQQVIFPNSDNIRHHVYSFSEPKQFEIKLYEGVPKDPILFDSPGLVVLGCNIHDSMLGYIFVSPWPDYAVSGEGGKASLLGSASQLAVWHPWMQGKTEPELFSIDSETNEPIRLQLTLQKPAPVRSFKGFRKRYDD